MNHRAENLYHQITGRKYTIVFSMGIAAVLILLADIAIGPAWLSIDEIFLAVFSPDSVDPTTSTIVWKLRLPIALMAIVVGASLAIAGAEMQTILGNPLASPYTLGVSASAGFGAALALVAGVSVFPSGKNYIVPINAFFFAMLTCLLMYSVAKKAKFSSETMVLAGIAILFLFQSLTALLQYIASEQQLQAVIFWLFGNLFRTTWQKLGISSAILLLTIPLLAKDAWKLTTLRLGDEKAESLGVNVERLRLKTFVLVSILTGAAVCFVGTIGFIGLAGPHIARMLVGEDQRFFLPVSALTGAILLSSASVLSKLIVPGIILPIGIITSFIGVPFFISLMFKKRGGYW
ncbi:MAG: iron ABC transporter permease [Desulfobacterales bacterium RIFOXYA12_FULL_46_15]|nr:MAG: iron ABC transporter permease [Desulfobacterales bacterium RIFOXYA12_FULL_46_15]